MGPLKRLHTSFKISEQPTLHIRSISQNTSASWRKSPVRRRKLTHRKIVLFCCFGTFAVLVGLFGFTFHLYGFYTSEYQQDISLAMDGSRHLQTAEGLIKNLDRGSFDTHNIAQLQQEFASAHTEFGKVKNDLEQIPGIATNEPRYGALLSAALKLVPIAYEVSQAGMIGCDALFTVISGLNESLSVKTQGLNLNDLNLIRKDIADIQEILNTTAYQVIQLQPADLQVDAHLSPAIKAFRSFLPDLQTSLQEIQSILGVAPALFGIGQPASYLIEQLDSTEVRPGGGFIGSYGITTILGGQLENVHMTDTYLLDNSYRNAGHSIPYPPAYQWFSTFLAPSSWSLRDSNLDADFPTAARNAEQIYHTEGGNIPLQGVIAVTPWLVENALKITGPIYVPEYHETISAQNLIDRIHYHQLQEISSVGDIPSPDGHSSTRKRFTELLFEHFFTRVHKIWPTAAKQFISLLRNSLYTKDIQLYLNSGVAESILQHYNLASAIQSPQGDSLFLVDADVSGGKPNNFIHYTLQDNVNIDVAGNVVHRTTLTYDWPVSTNQFQNGFGGRNLYHDYLRIYTPPGSILLMQEGWQQRTTGIAFGRQVWAGLFLLPYGQSGTITLEWMVHNAAIHDANGWHYHYLIQRQAGIAWNLNLQVKFPNCALVSNKASNSALNSNRNVILSRVLSTDLNLGINYHC